MTYLHVLMLSVVEGLTEFLPISSTGHLILLSSVFGIHDAEFVKQFEIIIQTGAIAAVFSLYISSFTTEKKERIRIVTGFIPVVFVGFFLYDFIRGVLLENAQLVTMMLFLGGIVLFFIDDLLRYKKPTISSVSSMSLATAIGIGIGQSVAVVPGVSRAAATIIAGLLLGLDRKTAVKFSFLLAVPTIVAASALDVLKSGFTFDLTEAFLLVVGLLVSYLSARFAIQRFLAYISNHSFKWFGVYRILLATTYWFVFLQ